MLEVDNISKVALKALEDKEEELRGQIIYYKYGTWRIKTNISMRELAEGAFFEFHGLKLKIVNGTLMLAEEKISRFTNFIMWVQEKIWRTV